MIRGNRYTWESGDTFHLIAHKYCRGDQWKDLLENEHNRRLLYTNNHIMRAGDIIEIPDHWFPLPTQEFTTKFVGSHGTRTSV